MNAPAHRPAVAIPDHELLRVIGRGSYGEVWLARNLMGTLRAVKIVRLADFEDGRPFEREFEGIKRYEPVSRTHEGLVQVLHVGMGAAGDHFYYVMELADDTGATAENGFGTRETATASDLAAYRARTLRSDLQRGPLPVHECVDTAILLAGALGHLHRHGLVHRDVKPSNIIFVNGRAKLADVGLVALMSDTRSIVGTEGFVAPEGTGHPRSDVYSLGKVLYECVTGHDRLRFPDVPADWMTSPQRKACFELLEIILKAGETDPKRRYADTDQMVADLALLQAGKSLRELRRMETRLRRALQVLAIASVAVAVALGAWALERGRREQIEGFERRERLAKEEARSRLAESLVPQARSTRLNGEAGAREQALRAVAEGLEVGAPVVDLRTQAASALGLVDMGSFSAPWPPEVARGTRVVFADGGKFAAVAEWNGTVTVWDRTGGNSRVAMTWTAPAGRHPSEVRLSRDGRWMALFWFDRSLSLLDVAARQIVHEWPRADYQPQLAFSRDCRWMLASEPDGIVSRPLEAPGERTLLVPGTERPRTLLIAPDGTWFAAQSADEKSIVIHHGLPRRTVPHAGLVPRLQRTTITSDMKLAGPSVSGDSLYLAAAVGEDRLRVWEIPSGTQVAWLRGHQRVVRGTAFHPGDSSLVASTGWDGTVRLWDIPSRQQVLVAHAGGDELALCPDTGEVLLRAWSGDSIRSAPLHWPRASRLLMLPANKPFGLFSSVDFSPDGLSVVAAGNAGVIAWDLQAGGAVTVEPADELPWQDAVFGRDGTTLWTSGPQGLVRHAVIRGEDHRLAIARGDTVVSEPTRHMAWVGGALAVGLGFGGNSGVRFIRPDGTQTSFKTPYWPDTVDASPDGHWLATTPFPNAGGHLWNLRTDPPVATPFAAPGRASVAFLTELGVMAVGWDAGLRFDPLPGSPAASYPALLREKADTVPGRVVVSPDGSLVAASTGSTHLTLLDGRTLRPLASLDSPLTPFDFSMAFSPDGSQLAVAGGVSRVMLWDIAWLRAELTRRGLGW